MRLLTPLKTILLCLTLLPSLAVVPSASAAVRYIDDKLRVPVRSGASNTHRILSRGIVSGTRVETLQTDSGGDFTLIRYGNGKEGWIPSQYLVKRPIARTRLAAAEKTIAALTSKNKPLQTQLLELRTINKDLTTQVNTLSKDKSGISKRLKEVESISSSAVAKHKQNRELVKENEILKNKINVLSADNDRLKQRSNQEWFINGAGAVGFGVLLTLVIPRLVPKKRSSNWS